MALRQELEQLGRQKADLLRDNEALRLQLADKADSCKDTQERVKDGVAWFHQ